MTSHLYLFPWPPRWSSCSSSPTFWDPEPASLWYVFHRAHHHGVGQGGAGPVGRWPPASLPGEEGRSRERPARSPETVTGIRVSTFPSLPGGC